MAWRRLFLATLSRGMSNSFLALQLWFCIQEKRHMLHILDKISICSVSYGVYFGYIQHKNALVWDLAGNAMFVDVR